MDRPEATIYECNNCPAGTFVLLYDDEPLECPYCNSPNDLNYINEIEPVKAFEIMLNMGIHAEDYLERMKK